MESVSLPQIPAFARFMCILVERMSTWNSCLGTSAQPKGHQCDMKKTTTTALAQPSLNVRREWCTKKMWMQPYADLLLIVVLLGTTPPPAGLPALGRLLLAAPPARLPAPLGRLPLGGGLPAGSPTTSLRCHGACSRTVSFLKGEAFGEAHQQNNTRRSSRTNAIGTVYARPHLPTMEPIKYILWIFANRSSANTTRFRLIYQTRPYHSRNEKYGPGHTKS